MIRHLFTLGLLLSALLQAEQPVYRSEFIFPLEHWHNHASSIVEAPNGDLLACWFHGSGERQADDVLIEGSRLRSGSNSWSPRFVMADTPGYPDTNCTLWIDPQRRLWLFWPTILANEWHTALMKYKISSAYLSAGAPQWQTQEVLHVTPGPSFEAEVERVLREVEALRPSLPPERREAVAGYIERTRRNASDKFFRRLGWMTRAHPLLVGNRLLVPLYSDGFSFSIVAFTDDWGKTWRASRPLVAGGNIQPSLVQRSDGSLYALMRDNGPAPKRLHQAESSDRGETWSPVTDSALPNPGSGAEVIRLHSGRWALVYNDLERGRQSLAISVSDDEGKSWKWTRHLEREAEGPEAGQYHYPSIIQSRNGMIHVSYSYHLNRRDLPRDPEGRPLRKTIKVAHFNEAWAMSK